MIYDANRISIEGGTDIAFTEDVGKRYEAYGWRPDRGLDPRRAAPITTDVPQLYAAIRKAQDVTDRPASSCCARSSPWPAPNAQNTGASHGSALGDDEVAATKKILGFDPELKFEVPPEVIEHTRQLVERSKLAEWRRPSSRPPKSAGVELYERLRARTLPAGWANLPAFEAKPQGRRRPQARRAR